MKIILDTNVFMSGIFWSGPPAKILEAWQQKKFDLIISTSILDEYVRVSNVLAKKYRGINIDDIIDIVVKNAQLYDVPGLPEQVSRDKDDDVFIACAVASRVKIIVSGDSDLLDVNGYSGITIIKPKQFVDEYI